MKPRISIIGLGWLGLPLAWSLYHYNYSISGTYSNPSRKDACEALPFPCFQVHISSTDINGDWSLLLQQSDVLIINIPPRRNTNGEIEYVHQINQIISHTPANTKVVFVSSTSVYGDRIGKITENTQPQPIRPSGKALLDSEHLLKSHFQNNLTILRFSGLIGPKRHPGRFLAGKKDLTNANGLVNMIHQDDCIQLISKVIQQNAFGYTINACTDQHPTRKEFYTKAAALLQLEIPEFKTEENSSDKYIDNTYSKQLLNHTYLSIKESLERC